MAGLQKGAKLPASAHSAFERHETQRPVALLQSVARELGLLQMPASVTHDGWQAPLFPPAVLQTRPPSHWPLVLQPQAPL